MAKFRNVMGITKIKFEKDVHCYCPLGESWCTYHIMVTMLPTDTIPDYCEIEQYIDKEVDNKEMTIESATAAVKDYLFSMYDMAMVRVSTSCADAKHFPVMVTATAQATNGSTICGEGV